MSLTNCPPIAFIIVRDIAVARDFYAGTLGLNLTGSDDYADSYDLSGTMLRVTKVADWSPSPHTVVGWIVTDIEASVATLAARGVTFKIYKGMDQDAAGILSIPDGSARIAWFNDPDGNNLSITQFG